MDIAQQLTSSHHLIFVKQNKCVVSGYVLTQFKHIVMVKARVTCSQLKKDTNSAYQNSTSLCSRYLNCLYSHPI